MLAACPSSTVSSRRSICYSVKRPWASASRQAANSLFSQGSEISTYSSVSISSEG